MMYVRRREKKMEASMKLDFDNSFFSPIAASAARGDEEEAPLDQGSLAGGTRFFFSPTTFRKLHFLLFVISSGLFPSPRPTCAFLPARNDNRR
jgi:hypothetical protein